MVVLGVAVAIFFFLCPPLLFFVSATRSSLFSRCCSTDTSVEDAVTTISCCAEAVRFATAGSGGGTGGRSGGMHPLHLPTTCRNDLGVSIAGAPRVQVKMYSFLGGFSF